jgi:alkanesulfonate monooxygenase SsuD/methylene tetrahydromethanopterin reductase-like flavin-dependent oxidoreductase (luciferase family)
MQIGVMIGPERGSTARKVTRMLDDIAWAEGAGLPTAWIPQIPNDMDALLTVALLGLRTERIELGTAVVPLQAQHPVALARQALSAHAITGGRLTLGVGPSHHWIVKDMLGLPYEKPAAYTRDYLEVLTAALHPATPLDAPPAAPTGTPVSANNAAFTGTPVSANNAAFTGTPVSANNAAFTGNTLDVENATFTVHNPLDLAPVAPLQILVAALGPVMLKIAGERADGTVLWMADERAIGEHVVPTITKAADQAGRPAPRIVAGLPVCLCANSQVDEARERANRILGEAEISPNYQRLLAYGDAKDIGDLCAVGDEEAIAARLQSFANAGATDLSIRLLPIGPTRDTLIASKHRTRDLLAALSATFASAPAPAPTPLP